MKLSASQWASIIESHGTSSLDDSPVEPISASHSSKPSGVGGVNTSELRNVAYVLALEGSSTPNPEWGFWEKALDALVQTAQPSPSITHIELCLAPNGRRDDMHFATYLGAKAGWGASFGGQKDFYLGHNSSQWRAVPVVAADASTRLRIECGKHVDTPYSLAKYICGVPPFRAFASFLGEQPMTSAHCGILTARCLKRGLVELGIRHAPSWFGPSSLFLELDSERNRATFHQKLVDSDCTVRATVEDELETRAMHTLLNGSDDDIVNNLDDDACTMAIHRLTIRALEHGLDDVARRIVQKQLATALLRHSVCRNS
jgi:hypothetical protein